jgi:hypothetical protein
MTSPEAELRILPSLTVLPYRIDKQERFGPIYGLDAELAPFVAKGGTQKSPYSTSWRAL